MRFLITLLNQSQYKLKRFSNYILTNSFKICLFRKDVIEIENLNIKL